MGVSSVCANFKCVMENCWCWRTTCVAMAGGTALDSEHLTISAEVSILHSKGLYLGVGHVHVHGIFCTL